MGIRFIAINDGYDSSNEIKNGTELDIQFKNLLNDYYSRDISEKMTTALLVAKKQGKYTSGTPPYGYLKDTEDNYKLVIDERVADNVRYIFQLLLEGHTLNETAKILNSEGVITARARRKEIKGYDAYANRWESNVEDTIWSHSMVRRIANNEVYTGTFVFNKSTKSKLDGGKVTYHPKEEWIRVYDNHEALISKETFDEVEGLLKSRHRKSFGVKKKKYQNSPLATFARCNKCGYKIRFGTSSNGKELVSINLYCYHCRMLEQEEKLPHYKESEKEVFEILKDKFHTDKAEKKKLLDEQKQLYDKNDQLLKKKRIEFDNRDKLEVAVSDLTYVRVGGKWNYVCTLIDLFNREIIGYSAGANKDAELIETALLRCRYPLKDISIFHSDRGNEYDNALIDNILSTFKIDRSLSRKGNPYDNAVSEATNKALKIEFIYQHKFETLEQLQLELAEHVYWYNNQRIHESLDYMTPIEYRELNTIKLGKVS